MHVGSMDPQQSVRAVATKWSRVEPRLIESVELFLQNAEITRLRNVKKVLNE